MQYGMRKAPQISAHKSDITDKCTGKRAERISSAVPVKALSSKVLHEQYTYLSEDAGNGKSECVSKVGAFV
jgi:hypothetical protein